jgi:hypothetical protein
VQRQALDYAKRMLNGEDIEVPASTDATTDEGMV